MTRAWREMNSAVAALVRKAAVKISRTGDAGRGWVQALGLDDGDLDDAPVYGPAGFWVRPTVDQEAVVMEATGETLAVGFSGIGHAPATLSAGGEIGEGEGGLYYAGTFKVFASSDGKLYLGCDKEDAAAEPVLAGDTFITLYDAHTHPTPFGPTGGPAVSGTTAKSTTVFVKP